MQCHHQQNSSNRKKLTNVGMNEVMPTSVSLSSLLTLEIIL